MIVPSRSADALGEFPAEEQDARQPMATRASRAHDAAPGEQEISG